MVIARTLSEREPKRMEKRALKEWGRSYHGISAVIDDVSEGWDSLADVVLKHLKLENMKSRFGRGPVKLYLFKIDGRPYGTIYSLWDGRELLEGYSRPSWKEAVRVMRSLREKLNGVLLRSVEGDRFMLVTWEGER